ncbi:MAG: hypothetical protein KC503_46785 [Myxococcales bacterium]|nr:hypothetical protein [Myxococcales bacterium]
MKVKTDRLAGIAITIIVAMVPTAARASQCIASGEGRFLVPTHVVLPANALGVPWSIGGDARQRYRRARSLTGTSLASWLKKHGPLASQFSVFELRSGADARVPIKGLIYRGKGTYLVTASLEPGRSYRFTYRVRRWYGHRSLLREWSVIADVSREALPPSSSGLGLRTALRRLERGSAPSDVRLEVTMNLPRVLRRFKDALLFELQCKSEGHRYIGCDLGECTVPRPDGRPFGRNRYLITNRCTTEWRRAAKVRFSVRMRAWLPGGASFRSEEETIDVSCRPSHVGLYVAVGGSGLTLLGGLFATMLLVRRRRRKPRELQRDDEGAFVDIEARPS